MKSSLPNLPAFKNERGLIKAEYFNRVQLALRRFGPTLTELLGKRGLEFQLGRDAWLCSDQRLNHMPMLAWTDFGQARRAALHEPVTCNVVYYNAYAGALLRSALEELNERIRQRLDERAGGPSGPRIVAFPAGRRG